MDLPIKDCFFFHSYVSLPEGTGDMMGISYNLTGAKRREWMGMGVAGMITNSYCGSFPKIPC